MIQAGVVTPPGQPADEATYPDFRDNRVVIRISQMNEALLRELPVRFGGDTIAIEVLPGGAPARRGEKRAGPGSG
jgi:hypothetical protein